MINNTYQRRTFTLVVNTASENSQNEMIFFHLHFFRHLRLRHQFEIAAYEEKQLRRRRRGGGGGGGGGGGRGGGGGGGGGGRVGGGVGPQFNYLMI